MMSSSSMETIEGAAKQSGAHVNKHIQTKK